MSDIKITNKDTNYSINLNLLKDRPYEQQVLIFEELDKLLVDINKQKNNTSKSIISYIKYTKIPITINKYNITLLALFLYFQKKFTTRAFFLDISKYKQNIFDFKNLNIISKANNFPHLIGIKPTRDKNGTVISKKRPREFLDGVIYQSVLIDLYEDYIIDFEKIEVFSWLTQTLTNPTYVLTKDAINTTSTKFDSDIIFVRKVMHSDKYAFHIIGLKNENTNNFTFTSQFAITKERYYRLSLMFDLEKAIFNFYKQ